MPKRRLRKSTVRSSTSFAVRRRRHRRYRERLKNADGQYATLKVYFAAIRENFVRAAELIDTFDGGDREKYTAAFVKLLDALREEITEK